MARLPAARICGRRFFRMETLEHFAKIAFIAKLSGEPQLPTTTREVAKLMACAPRGITSSPPPGGGAELPETCDGGENETDEVTLTRLGTGRAGG